MSGWPEAHASPRASDEARCLECDGSTAGVLGLAPQGLPDDASSPESAEAPPMSPFPPPGDAGAGCGGPALDAGARPKAGRSETYIIWDWDDTLLCSSSLALARPAQLAELAALAQEALEQAMGLGTAMIVTNAQLSWVKESAGRFMPGLLPMLDRLTIVSAREQQEHLHPGDYFAWKRECFRDILRRKAPRSLNLVALGDSPAEIQAAEYAAAQVANCTSCVKTVKFKEAPSPHDLVGELQAVLAELQSLVNDERSASRVLVPSLTSCKTTPCTWSLSDGAPEDVTEEMLTKSLKSLGLNHMQKAPVAACL
eukprot:CAMPEP_0168459828 /NCGR_PEP_ID=MMETSP0228-20121227/53125_1 /TAXON_ID=133427 /ORGANISM="Protoceratium reticulatum, Strain CCCM 535 (=CCMP 1889)" /LENGTH=311 /DNA_ID=CAMNT_0008475033 /DNA_START=15 /DNA_END=950 /DNA_ORIENTATION=+